MVFKGESSVSRHEQALCRGKRHNKGWNPESGKPNHEIGHKRLMAKVAFPAVKCCQGTSGPSVSKCVCSKSDLRRSLVM